MTLGANIYGWTSVSIMILSNKDKSKSRVRPEKKRRLARTVDKNTQRVTA